MKLFSDTLPFYKANFHTHTTRSDGRKTPAEVMALYRERGYDVLALTDHRKVTIPDPAEIPEGLLLIPGIELDHMLPGQAVHILGLGMTERIVFAWSKLGTPQQAVDAIRDCGGLAVLAHPAWSLNTPDFMASLNGICGTEIWNSVSTLPYNGDRADSSSLLDVMGASMGRTLPVFANDDAHFYGTELGAGWTMVQAKEKTAPAVMEALRSGSFYATRGPEIRQIEVQDGEVWVDCSPAETVVFYTALPWSEWRVVRAQPGESLTRAHYRLSRDEGFLRVQVIDRSGMSAWSGQYRLAGFEIVP